MLILDERVCVLGLCLRTTFLFQPNVAVLSPETIALHEALNARIVIPCTVAFVKTVLATSITPLPCHITQFLIGAVMILRRIQVLYARFNLPDELVDVPTLKKGEKMLRDMNGLPQKCLNELWYQLQINEGDALGYNMVSGWESPAGRAADSADVTERSD